MKSTHLLAAILLASGIPTIAFAQQRLPDDWDRKVSAVVGDPARAAKVVEAGRRYDAKRQESIDATRAADAKLRAVFLDPAASAADRGISLGVFRATRRKAVMAAVDALFPVKALVSKKEWEALWPEGYFSAGGPKRLLGPRLRDALPSVVTDPARQAKAMDVAAELVKALETNEAARRKAASRFEKNMADYKTPRDEFIDSADDLERKQSKTDDVLLEGATRLQQLLAPAEWGTLVARVTDPAS